MIAYLRGICKYSGTDYIVLEVNGIGHKVFVPAPVVYKFSTEGEEVIVYTHLYVREDALQLYGFLEKEELELFELLLQVSGIGPKGAVAVLSAIPAQSLKQAVINEQVSTLTKVPGIGKKTAQRLIIELKDKLAKMMIGGSAPMVITPLSPNLDEAHQALIALGYGAAEVRRAVHKITGQSPELGTEEIIKKALLELARF